MFLPFCIINLILNYSGLYLSIHRARQIIKDDGRGEAFKTLELPLPEGGERKKERGKKRAE